MKLQENTLKRLINEIINEESEAAAKAKKQGLEYASFGRWKDKKGNIVAKTENGKLVPVKKQAVPNKQQGSYQRPTRAKQGPPNVGQSSKQSTSVDSKKIPAIKHFASAYLETDSKSDKDLGRAIQKSYDEYKNGGGEGSLNQHIKELTDDLFDYPEHDTEKYGHPEDSLKKKDVYNFYKGLADTYGSKKSTPRRNVDNSEEPESLAALQRLNRFNRSTSSK